ncbi:Ig-like domain-containing protein [Planctomycetota bacterium]
MKSRYPGVIVALVLACCVASQAWAADQVAKLTASDGAAGDMFGTSVSLDGDTALMGAAGDSGYAGSAYLFTRSGSAWSQQAKIANPEPTPVDLFGYRVSLDDGTALLGSVYDDDRGNGSGSAYVFVGSGSSWSLQQKLTAEDGGASHEFGCTVSVSGDLAVIGARHHNEVASQAGAAYLFVREGVTWSERLKLTANDAAGGDKFGYSVGVSGETVLVGAHGDASSPGAAYVFVRSGASWSQQQKLSASDGVAGDKLGWCVSVAGDTALVGANGDDSGRGAAYVFVRSGTAWSQQQKLSASDGANADGFGESVSLSGDIAVVGATQGDGQVANSGSAYIFARSGTVWSEEVELTASDGVGSDSMGISVSVSGDSALVAAHFDDDRGDGSGSVYVFDQLIPPQLVYATYDFDNPVFGNDQYGGSTPTTNNRMLASPFVLGASATLAKVKLRLSDYSGDPPVGTAVKFEIWTDNNGGPGSQHGELQSPHASFGGFPGQTFEFPAAGDIALSAGTKYWLVVDGVAADGALRWVQDRIKDQGANDIWALMEHGETTWELFPPSGPEPPNDFGALSFALYGHAVPPNSPPTVQITNPPDGRKFNLGDEVTFTGTVSDPEDGSTLTSELLWSSSVNGDIPGKGGEVSTTSLDGGQHTITAQVTDSGNAVGSATITVHINTPPTVQITAPANGSTINEGVSTTFTGTVTDPEDGSTLTANLKWYFDQGGDDEKFGDGGSFSYDGLPGGQVTVTAKVEDSGDFEGTPLEGSASINLTINQAPTVTIQTPANGSTLIQNQSYPFQGSVVDDLDNDSTLTANLSWQSDAQGEASWSGGNTNHALQTLGGHEITASVTDSHGLQGKREISVTVINTAPTVAITYPPDGSTLIQNQSVTFTGTASDIQDAGINNNSLDWLLDGGPFRNDTGSFSYSDLTEGQHTIRAEVTDSEPKTGFAEITVHVENPVPIISNFDLDRNRTQFIKGEKIIFSATANDANNSPTGGAEVMTSQIIWLSSKDGQVGTGGSASPTLTVGEHTISANVTDRNGKAATPKTVNVEILNPLSGNEPIVAEKDVSELLGVYEAPNGVKYTLTYDNHLLKIEIYRPQTGKTAIRGVVWVGTDPPKAAFIRPKPDPTDANLGVVIVLLEKDEATGGLWQRIYPQGIVGARPDRENPPRKVLFKLVGK